MRRGSQISDTLSRHPPAQVRHALHYQVPPRTFWSGWCGGLSVAEAAGAGAWLFLQLFWLAAGLNRIYRDGADPTWQEALDGWVLVLARAPGRWGGAGGGRTLGAPPLAAALACIQARLGAGALHHPRLTLVPPTTP